MKHASAEVAAGKGYDSVYVPACGDNVVDSGSHHGHPSSIFSDTYVIFNPDHAVPRFIVEYVFDPEEASRSIRLTEYEKNPYVERYSRIAMEDPGHVRSCHVLLFVCMDAAGDPYGASCIHRCCVACQTTTRLSRLMKPLSV